jgi:hypothetical protein
MCLFWGPNYHHPPLYIGWNILVELGLWNNVEIEPTWYAFDVFKDARSSKPWINYMKTLSNHCTWQYIRQVQKAHMLSWQYINTCNSSQCFVRGYCLIARKDILQPQSILVIYGTRTRTFSVLFSRIAAQTTVSFASASASAQLVFRDFWVVEAQVCYEYFFWLMTDRRRTALNKNSPYNISAHSILGTYGC